MHHVDPSPCIAYLSATCYLDKEHFQCLALTAIANVGGKEFAEAMAQDVQKIVLNRYAPLGLVH